MNINYSTRVPSVSGFVDGTEKVSNFNSFWLAIKPSQQRWLKKVFCFLFMGKVGFRKASERFLEGFCSAGLTEYRFKFPAFLFFYSSYQQSTRKNPNPVLWWKKNNNIKPLLNCRVCLFPNYFTIWLILYDRRQKLEFLDTELGLPVLYKPYR